MSQTVDDVALLDTLRAGDPAALSALFEAYADRIYRLALGLLRDPAAAEDIVQETFLSALTHLDRFEGRSSVGTWLYRVAYNASMNRLRRSQEESLPLEDAEAGEADIPLPQALVEWRLTPEAILGDTETRVQLEAAIGALPTSLRAVFMLRDIEELSTEETAEALGISAGAAKVRLHRARLTLRERLAGYFAERLAQTGETV
jgi:RNA polymerase sigma-70 factor (ECF subfamily)